MEIHEAGARPTTRANPDYFTGDVWMEPVATPAPPGRLAALRVSFAPGARTSWHTHPLGQTIHVLSGVCHAQSRGGPVRRLRPGDTAFFAPGEEHWHGAAPDSAMVHLAMQESLDGVTADWLEPVSDADYGAAPA